MKLYGMEIKFFEEEKYYHLICLNDINNKFSINGSRNIYTPLKNTYCFGIQHTLFDILNEEGKDYLDKIFDFFKDRKETHLREKLKCVKNENDETKIINEISKLDNNIFITKKNWEYYIDENLYSFEQDGNFFYKKNIEIPLIKFGRLNSRTVDKKEGKTYICHPMKKHLTEDDITKIKEKIESGDYYKKRKKTKPKIKKAKYIDIDTEIEELCNRIPDFFSHNEPKNTMRKWWTTTIPDDLLYMLYAGEIVIYEVDIDNETELVHAFLEMIFQFEVPFNLKKCELCNKYFIREAGNQKKCNRTGKNGESCIEYNQNKKTNESPDIKKFENTVRILLYKRGDTIERQEFLKEYRIRKKEMDDKEYVRWLLSFYKYEKRRQNAIERYNLNQYID